MKVCSLCRLQRPIEDFYRDVRGVEGVTARCKFCHSAKSYESRLKHGRSARADYHWSTALKKYGMTPDGYHSLWEQQGGKCAICGEPERERGSNGEVRRLCVDHDHDTGVVRGLLCSRCNTGLGKFLDDQRLLLAAVKYLQEAA